MRIISPLLLLIPALVASPPAARAADGGHAADGHVAAAPVDAIGIASDARGHAAETTAAAEALLERIRHDPAVASDPKAMEELARDVDALPSGATRVEARMLIAEAWMHRMSRPRQALAVLRSVVSDPDADPLTGALAEREIVETLIAGGEVNVALAEAREHANLLDVRFVHGVERLVRRKWLARAAGAVLAAFAGLAAIALWRARRRGLLSDAIRAPVAFAPVAVAFVAFVAIGGGVLAARYESGSARPFLLLGVLSWPLVLLARAWSAVGSLRLAARAGRALLCGAALMAAAFILLDTVSPDYLEGFGL